MKVQSDASRREVTVKQSENLRYDITVSEPDSKTKDHGYQRHLDDVFILLSNSRRRAVLELLSERHESTVYELSRHIAGRENDVPPEQVTAKQRKRVYIGLHQNHLPAMDKQGVIEYDKNRGTVALVEDSPVSSYFTLAKRGSGKTTTRQLILIGMTLAITVGGLLASWLTAPIPLEVWSALAVLLLTVLAYDLRIRTN